MIDVNMDVLIGSNQTEFTDLEMNSGIKTLSGASDLTQIIATTILDEKVPKRITTIEGLRNAFRNSFDGSFGQNFCIKISNDKKIERFNQIGRNAFFETMTYYIKKSIGENTNVTNSSAMAIIDRLSGIERDLLIRLQEPIYNLHKSVEKQNYNVEIRRKTTDRAMMLIKLNSETFFKINEKIESPNTSIISAIITRFNALTGTGRLLLSRDTSSIPFRHKINWDIVSQSQKNKFSMNLDINNRRGRDSFQPLNLEVSEIRDHINELKVYQIHSVNES